MTEDESNWWEQQLPKPEELIPLSQTLITPDLAIAFDIWNPNNPFNHHHHQQPPAVSTPSSQHNSGELDSSELGGDEPARTLKRPRLVWTPQLHKRFVDAVAQLGIKNAVPKTIMQLMNIDGLTRENVASHLQKYRLYLKRMQGLSSGNGGGGFGSGGDPVTDRLFASSPVPPHLLHQFHQNSESFLPFMPVGVLQPQHHHQQTAAVAGHHLHRRYGSNIIRNLNDVQSATERKALSLFPIGGD